MCAAAVAVRRRGGRGEGWGCWPWQSTSMVDSGISTSISAPHGLHTCLYTVDMHARFQREAATLAYIVMAYIVMASIVMAYIVMAYMIVAHTVMAYIVHGRRNRSRARMRMVQYPPHPSAQAPITNMLKRNVPWTNML